MNKEEINSVKKWLNIDFDIEDDFIENLVDAAKTELYLSGVHFYDKDSDEYPLYRQAINYIVSRDYETRGYVEYEREGKGFNDNALQSFILKLKDW